MHLLIQVTGDRTDFAASAYVENNASVPLLYSKYKYRLFVAIGCSEMCGAIASTCWLVRRKRVLYTARNFIGLDMKWANLNLVDYIQYRSDTDSLSASPRHIASTGKELEADFADTSIVRDRRIFSVNILHLDDTSSISYPCFFFFGTDISFQASSSATNLHLCPARMIIFCS
jgi:hypothetical protein